MGNEERHIVSDLKRKSLKKMRPSRKKEREPANATIICFHGKSSSENVLRKKGPGKKVKINVFDNDGNMLLKRN